MSNTNITINNRTAMTASTAKSNAITSYESSCIEHVGVSQWDIALVFSQNAY